MVIGTTLSTSLLLLLPQFSTPNFNPNTHSSFSHIPRRFIPPFAHRGRRDASWGSNAEDVRHPGNSRFRDEEKRKWWFDDDDDDDLFGDEDLEEEKNIWDKIWIFKVFKSYGYLLPVIIASMLLTTGPMAFLMALALPLCQSLLALTFEKLRGETERPSSGKRRPYYTRSSNGFRRGYRKEKQNQEQEQERTKQEDYHQSDDKGGPPVGGKSSSSSFGGWDELDMDEEFKSQTSPSRRSSRPSSQMVNKGKLSRKSKRKERAFFLRLMVAVFPFLGSMFRML